MNEQTNLSQDLILLREAVGPQSRDYYADKFLQYSRVGIPALDWNAAGLLGFAWFFYRKIWSLVVPTAVLLIAGNFAPGSQNVSAVLFLCTSVIGCLFGTQLYYIWLRWLVAHARKMGYESEDALREYLRTVGGTADSPLRW